MNMDELEEMLAEVLPAGFQLETDKRGQVIVYTGLCLNDDGELEDFEPEPDEEDLDVNGEDFERLEEDEEEDDE